MSVFSDSSWIRKLANDANLLIHVDLPRGPRPKILGYLKQNAIKGCAKLLISVPGLTSG